MNEKANRVLNIVILSVCLAVSCFCGVNWGRNYFRFRKTANTLEQCRAELGQLRDELDNATDQQSALADGINRCTEISNRTDQLLSSSINTVEDLRTTLRYIREAEEDMASELYSLRNIINRNTDNDHNTN